MKNGLEKSVELNKAKMMTILPMKDLHVEIHLISKLKVSKERYLGSKEIISNSKSLWEKIKLLIYIVPTQISLIFVQIMIQMAI